MFSDSVYKKSHMADVTFPHDVANIRKHNYIASTISEVLHTYSVIVVPETFLRQVHGQPGLTL